MVSRKYST